MTTHRIIFSISLTCSLLIGVLDYQTGSQISMMLLYAVPILTSAWYCGKTEGIIVAFVATFCWLLVNMSYHVHGDSGAILPWNTLTRLGIFILLAYTVSLQSHLRRALEREKMRADTDRLTGLLNKSAFRERVEHEMVRAKRYNHPLSLAFIDLDNFKEVNDTQGHARGDELLQQVSQILGNSIRKTDIAGRMGGDEFTICFPETGDEQAKKAVEKLVEALDILTCQSGCQVTASIGIVTCLKISETYDTLLGQADKLMYVAKEKGKNAAEFMTF